MPTEQPDTNEVEKAPVVSSLHPDDAGRDYADDYEAAASDRDRMMIFRLRGTHDRDFAPEMPAEPVPGGAPLEGFGEEVRQWWEEGETAAKLAGGGEGGEA